MGARASRPHRRARGPRTLQDPPIEGGRRRVRGGPARTGGPEARVPQRATAPAGRGSPLTSPPPWVRGRPARTGGPEARVPQRATAPAGRARRSRHRAPLGARASRPHARAGGPRTGARHGARRAGLAAHVTAPPWVRGRPARTGGPEARVPERATAPAGRGSPLTSPRPPGCAGVPPAQAGQRPAYRSAPRRPPGGTRRSRHRAPLGARASRPHARAGGPRTAARHGARRAGSPLTSPRPPGCAGVPPAQAGRRSAYRSAPRRPPGGARRSRHRAPLGARASRPHARAGGPRTAARHGARRAGSPLTSPRPPGCAGVPPAQAGRRPAYRSAPRRPPGGARRSRHRPPGCAGVPPAQAGRRPAYLTRPTCGGWGGAARRWECSCRGRSGRTGAIIRGHPRTRTGHGPRPRAAATAPCRAPRRRASPPA